MYTYLGLFLLLQENVIKKSCLTRDTPTLGHLVQIEHKRTVELMTYGPTFHLQLHKGRKYWEKWERSAYSKKTYDTVKM